MDYTYTIVRDPETMHLYEVDANRQEIGAIDIETTIEDNPWITRPELVSVAVTFDGKHAWVFAPLGEWGTLFEKPQRTDYLWNAELDLYAWIMHNGLFDKLMLRMHDIDLELRHDTMAMQYLLDPDKPKSLEELAVRYLGAKPYKDVDYKHILEEPFERVAAMNAKDVCHTFNLFRPLADQINADKALSRIYQWILMPVLTELIQVTENGVPVDRPHFEEVLEHTTKEVKELRTTLEESGPAPQEAVYPKGWPKPSWWRVKTNGKWDGKTLNPGSVHQIRHILYDIWDMPVIALTDNEKNPQPSTNADTLLQLETFYAEGDKQRFLANLRQYRKQSKLLSAYLIPWPSLWNEEGWLHPRYKPLHVVTGRLSSESPNIQQVPRDKDFRNLLGGVEGLSWVKADYSQIELRLAAWLSQETMMLQAYQEGGDLHRLTAKLVLGDDSDDARQVGKTLNFGLLYGAGPGTLRGVARRDYEVFLSEEEAKRYHARFFKAYPGLKQWHKEIEQQLQRTGKIRSPLGRIRYLPDAKLPWRVCKTDKRMWNKKIGAFHEGLNHPIQSFANDLLLHSLIEVAPRLRDIGGQIVAVVHDEIDVLCPQEKTAQVAKILKETMEDLSWLSRFGILLTVPVLAEVEAGTHWGSLKELT